MSVFFVFKTSKSLGPTFNEAARILKENKNIMLLDFKPTQQMMTIKARNGDISDVRKSLPGWNFKSLRA